MATAKTEVPSEVTSQKTRPSNLCCYSQRVCNLEKLKGFDFCHKHILEDKASPFKPCDFYAKSNDRRCMNPAPKMPDKEKSYCIIHTRKAELRRAVEKRRKKRQREHSSTVEDDGEGSTTEKRRRTSSCASQKSMDGSNKGEEGHTSDEDLCIDLGLAGSLKVDSAWHGDVDSDAESVDSEEEDALRHAGIWTLDEVSKMCCDKMTRLKTLYMAQYKRLFHVLKEKRRKYLQLIQAEQDGERYASEILQGITAHSKRHGVEAILHKQAKDKRHGVSRHQNLSHQRCTHVCDGLRCPNKILPLTKFCIHHISHDPNQLLFQSCSFKTGEGTMCSNMVPKIYSYSTCQLHMSLTAEPSRSDVEKDLEEAVKRYQESKLSEKLQRDGKGIAKTLADVPEMTLPLLQEPDKQLPIHKALQQKSSALIPPFAPVSTTSDTSNIPDMTSVINVLTISPSTSKQLTIPNFKMEKMNVVSPALEGLPSIRSSDSTPMEVLSPASADSPAGIQSISPTLLAASLVAVCSASPSVSVTSALATSSTDLKHLVDTSENGNSTAAITTPVSGASAMVTTTTPVSGVSAIVTTTTPVSGASAMVTTTTPVSGASAMVTTTTPVSGASAIVTTTTPVSGVSAIVTTTTPVSGVSAIVTTTTPVSGAPAMVTTTTPVSGASAMVTTTSTSSTLGGSTSSGMSCERDKVASASTSTTITLTASATSIISSGSQPQNSNSRHEMKPLTTITSISIASSTVPTATSNFESTDLSTTTRPVLADEFAADHSEVQVTSNTLLNTSSSTVSSNAAQSAEVLRCQNADEIVKDEATSKES